MTLELVDLDVLKDAAIRKFDDRMARASQDEPLDREVTQLLAALEQIYHVVVLLQKNESDMKCVAEIWSKTVRICDEFARRLSGLVAQHPDHKASYDRILDIRNAAEERRRLHCRA